MKSFLYGLATGVAIGYLTAPRSGKDTRQKLTDIASDATKGLKNQWQKSTGQVVNQLTDLTSKGDLSESGPSLFAGGQVPKTDLHLDEPRSAQLAKIENDEVADTAIASL